jgi:hypothetical protein
MTYVENCVKLRHLASSSGLVRLMRHLEECLLLRGSAC